MADILFSYSNDGGRNFSNWRQRSIGDVGEYNKRVKFLRLGAHRQFVPRIRISDPVVADVLGAVAQVEGLGS